MGLRFTHSGKNFVFTLLMIVLVPAICSVTQATALASDTTSVEKGSSSQSSSKSAQAATAPNDPSAKRAAVAQEKAARDKIWNSPEMKRARAWVDDYLRVTNKYTPEQKAAYKKHLALLTAPQMEMWLVRFEHDQNVAKRKESGFQSARNAGLARDEAAIKQNRKELSDIEKGENTAAADEEKRLKSEQTFARSMYKQKQREATQMLEEYSSGGFGWGFGMGMR